MLRFLRSILSPSVDHEEIKVGIAELSALWLKYNSNFTSQTIEVEVENKPVPETEPFRTATGQQRSPTSERRFFSQEILSEFFEPYRSVFESQEAVDGFLGILELLDRHGSCPSVVTTLLGRDSETDEIYSVREILEKVSLREHSSNVARILLKLIKETYRDYENLIPKALVTAFGHDLGKIPTLRESGLYTKADHPVISAQKVGEIFSGKEPLWLRSVLDSIRDHHRSSKDQFTLLLKEADSRARETEIAALSREVRVVRWEEWFDSRRFLEILRPEINVIQTGRKWRAFSFGSTIYCQPDFLYEGAKRLAVEKKVVDMRLLRVSEKEGVIKKVVESLRQAGALGHEIGEPFWGRIYEIHSERFKKRMFLIPIRIEAFGIPHEIEKAKEGYLEIIRSVIPVKSNSRRKID